MCEVCGIEFYCPSKFARHALTHLDRELTQIQCDLCGKWMKNQNILRTHKLTHTQTPQQCPHCDKVTFNKHALNSHISLKHTAKKYQCTICTKSFARPILLKEHVATHTGTSLYKCSYCEQTFKNSSNMYKHLKARHQHQWNLDREKKKLESIAHRTVCINKNSNNQTHA